LLSCPRTVTGRSGRPGRGLEAIGNGRCQRKDLFSGDVFVRSPTWLSSGAGKRAIRGALSGDGLYPCQVRKLSDCHLRGIDDRAHVGVRCPLSLWSIPSRHPDGSADRRRHLRRDLRPASGDRVDRKEIQMTGGRRPGPLGEDHCAYRKPKLERNGVKAAEDRV